MSLLEAVTSAKSRLKPSETLISTPDGQQFIETRKNDGTFSLMQTNTKSSGYVIDTKPDMEMAEILPYLYLSSQDAANEPVLLSKYKIKRVLSIGVHVADRNKAENVVYKFIEFLDIPENNICDIFNECFEFIDFKRRVSIDTRVSHSVASQRNEGSDTMEGENVLVHCNAGISRSASVVIGYLMKTRRTTYKEAVEFVKVKRNVIKPNEGFVKHLIEYEKIVC